MTLGSCLRFGFAFLTVTAVAVCLSGPPSSNAQAKPEARYVGVQVCKACHQGQYETWSKTRHNFDFSKYPFYGKTINKYTFAKGYCASCHVTGVDKAGGYDRKKPWNQQQSMLRIQCETCHGPGSRHVAASSVEERKASINRKPDPAATCQGCHVTHYGKFPIGPATDKEINDIPRRQSAMLHGFHGYEYSGLEYQKSLHVNVVKGTCVTCHVNPVRPHDLKADIETCRTCHGGAKTFDINGRQTEIKALEKELKDKLAAFKKVRARVSKDPNTSQEKVTWGAKDDELAFNRANYNYLFVSHDKSHGVHNYKYARDLLKASIAKLP